MPEYSVLCEYLEGQLDRIRAGEAVILEVHDMDTWERKVVRALVFQSPEGLTDVSLLKVEEYGGDLRPQPWAIRILEELEPDSTESRPLSEFRRRGR